MNNLELRSHTVAAVGFISNVQVTDTQFDAFRIGIAFTLATDVEPANRAVPVDVAIHF